MKLFNILYFLVKTLLSLAGIAFLIRRLSDSGKDERYTFTIDAAISNEKLEINNRSAVRKKFDISDLQSAHFRSMDN